MSNNELRRCWQTGFDCAQDNAELSYWHGSERADGRLEQRCADRDADLESPEGWAAWLMGFATGVAGSMSVEVHSTHTQKLDELE
jgi:hypothetical protein